MTFTLLLTLSLFVLSEGFTGKANPIFRYHHIGIFSECYEKDKQNLTELNHMARLARSKWKAMNKIITNDTHLATYVQRPGKNVMYDVCDNETKLIEIIENTLLEESNFAQEPLKTYSTLEITGIIIYLPNEMTKRVLSIIHDIPIYDLHNKEFIQDIEKMSAYLTKFLQAIQWENLILIGFEDNSMENLIYHSYYKDVIQHVREARLCFRYHVLKDNHLINETMNYSLSWFKEHQPSIILFGMRNLQLKFLSTNHDFLKKVDIPLILHEMTNYALVAAVPKNLLEEYSSLKLIEFTDLARSTIRSSVHASGTVWSSLFLYQGNVPEYFKLGQIAFSGNPT